MNDPPVKRPFVEDPSFLDALNDLDRGLDLDLPLQQPALPSKPPSAPTRRPRATGAPESPRAASPPPASPTPAFAPPAPPNAQGTRHRPLMDLFPPSMLVSERPPGPILGTAVGPDLPDAVTTRVRADAAPPARPGPLTYETFYGLREAPFALSTDPRFFFHSNAHERVAAELLTAIRRREGLCLLTGELGVGKTTLCRAIVGGQDRRTVSSVVLEPAADVEKLLEIVLVDFGVMPRDELARAPRATRAELLGTLTPFLDSLVPLQASAVVVLDEAHRQPTEVLEQISALAADGAGARLLQVVLVGQPSFAASLKKPPLRAIDSAITTRCELGPLAPDEIGGYVRHRLAVAGTRPRVDFDDAALQRIHDLSRGVPGVVNLLCDRALAGGFERSASTIDVTLVDAAAMALDIARTERERHTLVSALLMLAALLALMLVGAAGAAWVFRDALARTIAQWSAPR